VLEVYPTATSTDPEVGYKPQSPRKLEYIRLENGTSTDCAFFSQVDYFRIAVTREELPSGAAGGADPTVVEESEKESGVSPE
jgi:hypothetical protein